MSEDAGVSGGRRFKRERGAGTPTQTEAEKYLIYIVKLYPTSDNQWYLHSNLWSESLCHCVDGRVNTAFLVGRKLQRGRTSASVPRPSSECRGGPPEALCPPPSRENEAVLEGGHVPQVAAARVTL